MLEARREELTRISFVAVNVTTQTSRWPCTVPDSRKLDALLCFCCKSVISVNNSARCFEVPVKLCFVTLMPCSTVEAALCEEARHHSVAKSILIVLPCNMLLSLADAVPMAAFAVLLEVCETEYSWGTARWYIILSRLEIFVVI